MESNSRKRLVGFGFIDDLQWNYSPHRAGHELIVNREYARVAEGLDLLHPASWVTLRRVMQAGGSDL